MLKKEVQMQRLLLWICIMATLGLEVRGGTLQRQQRESSLCLGKHAELVAMPGSCNGFFVCVNGNAIANSCGNFYRFNAVLGFCDHPWNVHCNGHSLSGASTINEVSSDTEAMFVCARSAPEGHIFAKALSCNQFYVCRHKTAVRRICPPQRHFNLKTKVCQDVGQMECIYSNNWDTTTVIPYTIVGTRQPETVTMPSGTTASLEVSLMLPSVCSGVKENTAVAHPLDCEKFIYCLRDWPLVLSCPRHLHFSANHQRCELPTSAECFI